MRAPDVLAWIEELLPAGYLRKSMFGGFAYYLDDLMVLASFEGEGSRSYRGQAYPFELWNGLMFPVERPKQAEVLKSFKFLTPHPVLGKWLYLPLETEDFEVNAETILKELRRRNPLFGSIPKAKKGKTPKKTKDEDLRSIDTSKPLMFREELPEEKLKAAKKISDLRNLGPTMERVLHKAGIKTVDQFVKLGWQKVMGRLILIHPRYTNAIYAYVLIGALKNVDWNHIPEEDKAEAIQLMAKLRKENPKSKSKKRSAQEKTKAKIASKSKQERVQPKAPAKAKRLTPATKKR